MIYHKNGQLFTESNYVNESKHGKFLEYFENGQLYEDCDYNNGKIHGKFLFYYGNGNLREDYNRSLIYCQNNTAIIMKIVYH